MVWGDDFLCVADDADLKWMEQLMKSHYDCKSIWVGPGADCVQEARVLGRIVTYCSWGIQYEADPTLAERLVRDCGLENANPVTTPWADDAAVAQATASASETRLPLDSVRKTVGSQKHLELDPIAAQGSTLEESPELDEPRAKAYKSLAAVLNFLALDRADLQFPAKELMRRFSAPREVDEARLRRAVRYVLGTPRLVLRIPWHAGSSEIVTFVDSNFAGCPTTRKSTTGGAILWCGVCVKSWSRTQPTIALSSGEAELAAVVAGVAEGLGMIAVLADFGLTAIRLTLKSDATAAIGITQREGLGKVRHLATADLWAQQRLRKREFSIAKVPGAENPADLGTKGLEREAIQRFLRTLGMARLEGRAAAAPSLKARSTESGSISVLMLFSVVR